LAIGHLISEVVYGIVREEKDESAARLDHDFEATVSWSAEPDPSKVTDDHDVARRVAGAYNELRNKIVADDWSAAISNYLEQHHAARVRGDGRVHLVPCSPEPDAHSCHRTRRHLHRMPARLQGWKRGALLNSGS
jgi:hypothetical protein